MSFASETKNELARIEPEKKCCMLAEIAAYIRTAGSIGIAGFGRYSITMTTDNAAVARHLKKLIKTYFDIETNLEIYEGPSSRVKQLLMDAVKENQVDADRLKHAISTVDDSQVKQYWKDQFNLK